MAKLILAAALIAITAGCATEQADVADAEALQRQLDASARRTAALAETVASQQEKAAARTAAADAAVVAIAAGAAAAVENLNDAIDDLEEAEEYELKARVEMTNATDEQRSESSWWSGVFDLWLAAGLKRSSGAEMVTSAVRSIETVEDAVDEYVEFRKQDESPVDVARSIEREAERIQAMTPVAEAIRARNQEKVDAYEFGASLVNAMGVPMPEMAPQPAATPAAASGGGTDYTAPIIGVPLGIASIAGAVGAVRRRKRKLAEQRDEDIAKVAGIVTESLTAESGGADPVPASASQRLKKTALKS